VGASGWQLSYLELNDLVFRGLLLSGHLPGTRDSWVRAESGHKDESDRADRW
jgi:hypothetical protein